MGGFVKRTLFVVAVFCLPLLWQGCPLPTEETGSSTGTGSSTSRPAGSVDSIDDVDDEAEAAPPTAGPDELPGPTALRFPDSVTIQVSDAFSTTLAALSLVDDNGNTVDLSNLKGLIDATYIQADSVNVTIDGVMSSNGLLGGITITRGSAVTNFETVISGGGSFRGWGLYIDFSAFSSAKSTTSQCAGNTQDLPVCFRVWAKEDNLSDWQRILAGYMTALPDDEGEGAGFFWFNPDISDGEINSSIVPQEAVQWDHRDPAAVATESFGAHPVVYDPSGTRVEGATAPFRYLTAQWGGDGSCPLTLFKSSNSDFKFSQSGGSYTLDSQGWKKQIGSWDSCGSYWGGKFTHTYDTKISSSGYNCKTPTGDLNDWVCTPYREEEVIAVNTTLTVCLLRSNGDQVARAQCIADGVDVGSENFLSEPSSADYTFPSTASFPLSP